MDTLILANAMLFLSTLSLRRATTGKRAQQPNKQISIHALLAESDTALCRFNMHTWISIHALLAESDIVL